MTWLFPLYLLGAGAILAPILMHLRRRPPQNQVEFSSLMFLEAQTPVPVSRRRLEHWLLLLLRCLVLLLLALMFARPLWRRAGENTTLNNEATVILLDRSGSLQRGDLWKRAVAEAEKVLGAASMDDRIAFATFDSGTESLWTFGEDAQATSNRARVISERLEQTRPGWDRTDLGRALVEAASWFGSASGINGRRKQVVVISDLQEGTRLEALRSMVWPEDIAVRVVRMDAPNGDNFSLALAAGSAEEVPEKESSATAAVRVRLANTRDSKSTDYTLGWEDTAAESLRGYLPPGASRVLTAPPRVNNGQQSILRISGDAWDFDNRIHVAPPQPKKVRVVFVGDEKTRNEAASPLYYLSRALRPTAAIEPELVVIPAGAKVLPPDVNVVFVTAALIEEALLERLRAFMAEGGLCIHIVDSTRVQSDLRRLAGALDLNVETGDLRSDEYLMLGEMKTDHPLLRPFADPRLRDFTKLRFWKHRRISLGPESAKVLQVIAEFDNGDPALLTRGIGKGTLILLASGWHPADSQLALSTKFVPMIYGWLEAAGFDHEVTPSLLVGDPLPAPAGATVKTPDRKTVSSTGEGSFDATMPGFYEVTVGGGAPTVYAVNLPPEESRIAPLEPEVLREWGVHLENAASTPGSTAAVERERLAVTEEEARQRAWLWILMGLLAMLGAETFLAGRIKSRGEVLAPGT